MAPSHRYCDHPATKSARAKCRRERERTGRDYQEDQSYEDAWTGFTCPQCGRRTSGAPFQLCPICQLRNSRSYQYARPAPPPNAGATEIVSNDNGGYRVTRGWKGQENLAADDAMRSPICRRIVQLERKAASTSAHEAAALMAAALRFRTREGLVGQVI